MRQVKTPAVSNAGAWAMNIISSVSIIMVNKQLMAPSGYGFLLRHYFLLCSHNIDGIPFHCHIPRWVDLSQVRVLHSQAGSLWELLRFSIAANLSITGMNFSLMLNSVGFYQISKLSMIPVVCFLEWLLHNKNYSRRVIMSVFVVAFGVGICTVTDLEVNTKGLLCASVAVLSTSLQQIMIGSLQKKYSIGSFELLSNTAPIQAASLLLVIVLTFCCLVRQLESKNIPHSCPFVSGNFNVHRSLLTVFFYRAALHPPLLHLAVFCNASQYICIGRFSAVSFQVLGHTKTLCVLILGWMLFDSALTVNNVFGMMLAVLGMIFYSSSVEAEKQEQHNPPLPGAEDEEAQPLNDRPDGAGQAKA
ncbi:unnamed protein product [Spirodela intermedia]|uniref:Sugar phosphate transporter domain-containing protein n=1 Tax=Spirodela intermedia TaxID=51605 RepID=A0A7I8IYC7_SPIIN|nr:unnamed protein product [Spirodela intermedia]CAA6662995.1 unnamed protein product [Spirodela intermedia]